MRSAVHGSGHGLWNRVRVRGGRRRYPTKRSTSFLTMSPGGGRNDSAGMRSRT